MTRSKGLEGKTAQSGNSYSVLSYPPLHPACCPGESPIGYLVRLVGLNGYGAISWMCMDGQLPRLSALHQYPNVLANSKWTAWDTEMSSISTAVCLVEQSHRLGALRYCPLCIEETSRWKAIWHLKVSVMCSEHGCWLRDTCPACGSSVPFASRSTRLCNCGAYLSESALSSAPDAVRRQQDFLERGSVVGSLVAAGHCLDLQARSELVLLFTRFVGSDSKSKTGINTRVLHMDTASSVMAQTAHALFGGSEGFVRFLDMSFSVGRSSEGERRLKRFYKAFYRAFEDNCFESYKQLFEQYLNEHWPRALSRRHSLFRERTIQSHPWLALQAACRNFCIPKSRMKRAVASNEVRSMLRRGPKRESMLVWKEDVIRLKEQLDDSLTAKDAAEYLGVTKKQFGQIQKQGYFAHKSAPGSATGGVWTFSKQEISEFLKELVHSGSEPQEIVAMNQALKRFRAGVKEPLVIIVEAIREGVLIAYGRCSDPTIRELVFENQQFEDWYRGHSLDSKLFSITEAAKRMGIHQEFAYQLARTGLLETQCGGDQSGKSVSQQAIAKFHAEYVLLRDLAREAGRSSASVMRYLASQGIHSIDADWDQPLRQKVYLAISLRGCGMKINSHHDL